MFHTLIVSQVPYFLVSVCICLLLQNIDIPIVSYSRKGNFMEVDTNIHSEEANIHFKAIKEFSPFNEYSIGQKVGLFDETGTGTQIYIWNLDKWGSDYSLEWFTTSPKDNSFCQTQGDILIRSKRIRSRIGQISNKVIPFFFFLFFCFTNFLNSHTLTHYIMSLTS